MTMATATITTMNEPTVYLEKMSAFARQLRDAGLTISPQETADACQVLISMGFEDRAQVKTILRTVYAKSREEQAAFDRVFESFFLTEDAMRAREKQRRQQEEELEKARQESGEDLNFDGKDMDFTPEQREAYATIPEEKREKLRKIKEKYKENATRNPGLYDGFIRSVFMKSIMEQQMLNEDAALNVAAELDPELGILYRDIARFSDQEIPKAIAIIENISRQINGELSAKRKNRGRSAKLDFRRTIRKGLETGGSFYRLKYKKKRQRRKHLVLLCDVSGSMIQFSEFALRFIQSLNHVAESSRVFLFSEDLFEADPFSLQNMDLFREYVRRSGAYGRGTDIGGALEELCYRQPPVLNDATTLILLSDTKTVDQARAIAALKEAKRQAGRVICLNPIPESKWKYIKSAQAFASVCTMISCYTLSSLANACRKLADR